MWQYLPVYAMHAQQYTNGIKTGSQIVPSLSSWVQERLHILTILRNVVPWAANPVPTITTLLISIMLSDE